MQQENAMFSQNHPSLASLRDEKYDHNMRTHRTANPRVTIKGCGICIGIDLRIKDAEARAKELGGRVLASAPTTESLPLEHGEIPPREAADEMEAELQPLSFPSPLPQSTYCSPEDFTRLRPTKKAGRVRKSRLSPKEGAARINAWIQCGGDSHILIERYGFDRYSIIYGTAYTYRASLPREVWRAGWDKQPKKGNVIGHGGSHEIKPVFDTEESDHYVGVDAPPCLEHETCDMEPCTYVEPTDNEELEQKAEELFEDKAADIVEELNEERSEVESLQEYIAELQAELAVARRPFIIKRAARAVWRRIRAIGRIRITVKEE